MKYYECKTNVEKVNEEGQKVGNRFSYLVQADSCTRAEQLVKAEYENTAALVVVTDVVGRKFNELITDECDAPELKYYKIVYTITSLNSVGLEIDKKEAALVAAEKLTDATALLFEKFDKSMHKPVLLSVVETPIVEFIKDTNEETPDA
jgi:hypothetical protein|nr:MAG TPA: protein of unknown function (DUF4494) [Caudoviricetes sp.]